jgi:hypothetical protein
MYICENAIKMELIDLAQDRHWLQVFVMNLRIPVSENFSFFFFL